MAVKDKKANRRSQVGYGSSYRRGTKGDLADRSEIGTVLGGQVWLVKPDKKAETTHPCLWMQTGVVGFKNCSNFYDCTTCKYDRGMQKRVKENKQISWQDAMRKREGLQRVCRHSLTNRIENRVCAYDYACHKCEFDQFFEDVWSVKTDTGPREVTRVRGFEIPAGHYFHNGHTWIRIESGGTIRIGMDDFALRLLGSLDAFDLPLMGKELDQDRVGWGLRREDNRAGVLSPVDGVIVEVNGRVRENPELVGRRPYDEGWLFMVRTPDVKKTIKRLMDDSEGPVWMREEISRLEDMIESVAGPLAADGGYLGDDIYGNIPELGWAPLTKTFLRT